jgi:DHA2 family multidrug resistance protein
MIQWNKAHYAKLREAITPGSVQTQAMLGSLQDRMESAGVTDPEMAALKQVYSLVMREAEVMTINSLFHALALVFFLALLLMPLVKKVSANAGSADAH